MVVVFFLEHSLEVVKNLFVKQDWTIGYYGLLFHLTYFKTVLEFLRKLITNYISEKKIPIVVEMYKRIRVENNVETVVQVLIKWS